MHIPMPHKTHNYKLIYLLHHQFVVQMAAVLDLCQEDWEAEVPFSFLFYGCLYLGVQWNKGQTPF